jgi:hypothetical protein
MLLLADVYGMGMNLVFGNSSHTLEPYSIHDVHAEVTRNARIISVYRECNWITQA